MSALETRERILAAATELFARYGYMKTSLGEIARAARLAKASIYYYFPSKEEVFLEALRNKAEEFFRFLEHDIREAASFEDKLSCFLRLPMKYIFELMPILAEAFNHIPSSYLGRMEENRLEYHQRMSALFGEIMRYGQEKGIVDRQIDCQRIGDLVNDWFLMGDSVFDRGDQERIIARIERDHELIIHILLWGIIKRKA